MVPGHPLGGEVGVEIDDRQAPGKAEVQVGGDVALEKEVVADEGACHFATYFHASPVGNSNRSRDSAFIVML